MLELMISVLLDAEADKYSYRYTQTPLSQTDVNYDFGFLTSI